MDEAIIQARIREINDNILECLSAKAEVETVKNNCTTKKKEWQNSFNKLANNSELAEVKKTDAFEGDMAETLQAEVEEAITQITKGISKADQLEDALDLQGTKLEKRIQQLKEEKQRLEQQKVIV